jgi:AcrR family transcriptional regulator
MTTTGTSAPQARLGRSAGSARDRLLSAALARFDSESLVSVSLDDIRQEAGVSVGALYHHFSDKAGLFDALYLDLTKQFQAGFLAELRSHATAQEGIEAGVRFYLRWVIRNRPAAGILLGYHPDDAVLAEPNRRFFADVMAWWLTHVHYGTLRILPPELIHALWLGPAQEYTRHWLAGHAKRPAGSLADTLAHAAWKTLKEPS